MNNKVKHKKLKAADVFVLVLMTAITLCVFIPFYNAIVISFSTSAGYMENPFAFWPKVFTLDNYKLVLEGGQIWQGYANTIFITVVGTAFSMAISVAGAYAFSRKAFPGKKFFFMMMLFTMFFSGGMIPTYLNLKNLGLLDTRAAIILQCGISAFNIIVMKSGFESIPEALEEAAGLDGANDIQIFTKVMLPLQISQIATFTLFTAVSYWNEWFWPMLVINTGNKMPLMSYLRAIVMEASGVMADAGYVETDLESFSLGVKMATVVLTMAPIMCVYPFLQKHFTKGVMVGAVKT